MNLEVREKGILIVKKAKKGYSAEVEVGGKKIPLSAYAFKDDSLNGKECEIERPGGTVQKLFIDGKEYPKKAAESKPQKDGGYRQLQQLPRKGQQWGGGRGGKTAAGGSYYVDVWKAENAQLPKDTRGLIRNRDDIDNYYLLLNKAAQLLEKEENKGFRLFVQEKPRSGKPGKKLRVEPKGYGGIDFQALLDRLDNGRRSAEEYEVVEIGILRPEWRMVVGLGGESVYETSMTLHHIYGFPYIPGSAIKGVTRHHIVTTLLSGFFPEDNLAVLDKAVDMPDLEKYRADKGVSIDEALKALQIGLTVRRDKDVVKPSEALLEKLHAGWDELDGVREVFGNQSKKGKVIFLDAFPVKPPKIRPDIMNPHFSGYYAKQEPPVDSMSPIPVHFLTVEGSPFKFAIMAEKRYGYVLEKQIGNRRISDWVKDALLKHGIGAKTSVGYGFLRKLISEPECSS
ncbi:MAG: type III-B CRISPR module RAMP protein Cmr6 [Actinobacteria bacterium]|nr:type III-B CRISPR module RAMP protein Cmr6 [Actinomycetota bacterium]